jgi:hypothetical protein
MNYAKVLEIRIVRYYNGVLFSDSGWTVFRVLSESLNEYRQSVDTGSFTPGKFRINAYLKGKVTFSGNDGDAKYEYNSGLNRYIYSFRGRICLLANATIMANMVPSETTHGYLRKHVMQRAMAKVGASNLQLGVELGELRETLEMLRHPFKDLRSLLSQENYNSFARALRLARSGKTSGYGAHSANALVSSWLEIRYGLRPLISSILDISKEVSKKAVAFNANIIRRARSSITEGYGDKVSNDCGGAPLVLTSSLTSNFNIIARGCVYYKLEHEPSVAEKYGLSLADIPEIAWELTRLSFVVDWVFSIGPWLGSYRYTPWVTILGATTSLKISGTVGATFIPHSSYNNRDWQSKNFGACCLDSSIYSRTLDTTLPSTPLFRWGQAVDLLRTIDALSLTLQPILKKISKLRK